MILDFVFIFNLIAMKKVGFFLFLLLLKGSLVNMFLWKKYCYTPFPIITLTPQLSTSTTTASTTTTIIFFTTTQFPLIDPRFKFGGKTEEKVNNQLGSILFES